MTIKTILERYLREHGYDGLSNAGLECACKLVDLVPCSSDLLECEPGYEAPCVQDSCSAGGGCTFHIVARKPRAARKGVRRG